MTDREQGRAEAERDSFTMEKLLQAKRLIDTMPPAPVFASWTEFPRDHAIQFKDGGRDYVGAHPDFWAKIPASTRGQYQSLSAIQIIDLSLPCYTDEKAKFLLAMRRATLALLRADAIEQGAHRQP